jgi:hypothetical protein
MALFNVVLKDYVVYKVEASDKEQAIETALEYWDEREPDIAIEEPEEEVDEGGVLDKFDTELILQTAIDRIGEFGHIDKKTGGVVPTYEKLIKDIQEMMCEVGIPI